MKIKIILFFTVVFFLWLSCLSYLIARSEFCDSFQYYTIKQYSDSSYNQVIDSFSLKLASDEIFKINDGYFAIASYTVYDYRLFCVSYNIYYENLNEFYAFPLEGISRGEYKNKKQVGYWQYISYRTLNNVNYNMDGKFDGTSVYYSFDESIIGDHSNINYQFSDPPPINFNNMGTSITAKNYQKGKLIDIQKVAYFNGKLAYQYELDSIGYINEVLFMNQDGDTLFYNNLTPKGTGYVKFYDEWGILLWEGFIENRKPQGWHLYYNYDGERIDHKILYLSGMPLMQTGYDDNRDSVIRYMNPLTGYPL